MNAEKRPLRRPEKRPEKRTEKPEPRTEDRWPSSAGTKGRLDTPRDPRQRLTSRRRDDDAFGVFAEQFARFMGTARFLVWMTAFVTFWVLWNVVVPASWKFDEYPFIFLTLMLSLQASYAAPLILLAQDRQEKRDKVVAEQDRQANARGHADMEFLSREVASLRLTVGEMATRDFLRSELKSLLAELDERAATQQSTQQTTQQSTQQATQQAADEAQAGAGDAPHYASTEVATGQDPHPDPTS